MNLPPLTFPSIVALVLTLMACNGDDGCVEATPGAQIDEFLEANGLAGQETTTSTGLVYIIEEPGDSVRPTLSDEITINYRGYYPDGETFDETTGTPRTFPLANLIAAWQEGLPLIGQGGEIRLLAPPALAYGPNPPAGIRCGSILVFDIELIAVP